MISLLSEEYSFAVKPTNLSKKITIEGKTKAYPVYRVRLDCLYYNEQNDRIATWISQYESEHGPHCLSSLAKEDYNAIIEQFIVQSNETALEKTQLNIKLVNQREPGVVLADGRIIDGNRRFTCLRRLAVDDPAFNWFEAVILDTNIEIDKKQIKMLELAIQHGEEKKVDYNPVDRLVGVYRDLIETKLLSIEEYAFSTNESVADVKKRIECAILMAEFLEYIKMPKQWYVAKEYQVATIMADLLPLLRKLPTEESRQEMKNIVFQNILMCTIGDERRFIRNLNSMMESGFFLAYAKDQKRIGETLQENISLAQPETMKDLKRFVKEHDEINEELQLSLDKSLLKAKKHETRNRPSQIISKSLKLLRDVDANVFEKLNDDEKENLRAQIDKLSAVADRFGVLVDNQSTEVSAKELKKEDEKNQLICHYSDVVDKNEKKQHRLAKRHIDEPLIFCCSEGNPITSLNTSIKFSLYKTNDNQKDSITLKALFFDRDNNVVSDTREFTIYCGEEHKELFCLVPAISSADQVYLGIRSSQDEVDELQQVIPFDVKVSFVLDADF